VTAVAFSKKIARQRDVGETVEVEVPDFDAAAALAGELSVRQHLRFRGVVARGGGHVPVPSFQNFARGPLSEVGKRHQILR